MLSASGRAPQRSSRVVEEVSSPGSKSRPLRSLAMYASLRALMTNVIDYAGLFPPAQLPLDQALRNYASYREGPDAWMLGRFVCPAAKLAELTSFPPLSVVGCGGD